MEIVELLIAKGADVNAKDGDGVTPLDWANDSDYKEVVELLRKNGAKTGEELEADEPVAKVAKPESPTNARNIPLVLAAESGSIESVKLHIAAGTDLNINYGGSNALYEAVLEGHNEIIELLIEAGANVNLKHGIHGDTPLYPGAIKGRKKICELLITKGADVNAKRDNGRNPLHIAAFWGHTEVVKLLISKGANINEKDNWDETPLDLAIAEENFLKEQVRKETANLLRKHGGKTGVELSIHKAAEAGNIEAVKQHLAAGTNVNAKNNDGNTPLHVAAYYVHKEIVELLIAEDADLNAKDEDGGTPLDNGRGYLNWSV